MAQMPVLSKTSDRYAERITALRLAGGLTALALLSGCASSGPHVAVSTDYYESHAAGDYTPPGPPSDPWGPYISLAASRFDVPPAWIRQVMRAESGGHEYIGGQLTVSGAGAMGLMQLEPETYQEMAARYGLGSDPFNPYDNIMAGTAYIHEMYQIYGSPGFLAAYDAGPGRLNSYMNEHVPLPHETINYIAMIAPRIQGYYPVHRSEADELALNTMPAREAPGLLPDGFVPAIPYSPMPGRSSAPVEVAAIAPQPLPETAVYAPAETSLQTPLPPPPPPPPSFSLIPAAMADTPSASQIEHGEGVHAGWAIQVGAYNSSANARAAIGIAELSAIAMLMNGHPMVVSVHYDGITKYRARVVGLPRENAINACAQLAAGRTGCVVLSPDAQS